MNNTFLITTEQIQEEKIREALSDDSCGAVVFFDGRVRNHHEGRCVESLSYEHHPLMAEPEGQTIIEEVLRLYPITHAVAVHRVGSVPIGEAAVITAVSSSHRQEAFKACQYLINEIKARVPIWKFETYEDGTSLYTEQCEGCRNAT